MLPDWTRRAIVVPWERLQTPWARYGLLAALLAAYLAYAWLSSTGWGLGFRVCPWWRISGDACPLCGLTTAFGAMFRGDWTSAATHHPAGPILFLATIASVVALVVAGIVAFRRAGRS